MAIVKTRKISIYVVSSQFNPVMELLHKKGIMEITGKSDGIPEKIIRNIAIEQERTSSAIKVIKNYAPKKNRMLKRKKAALTDYTMDRKQTDAAIKAVSKILALDEKLERNLALLETLHQTVSALEDFESLDVPLGVKESEFTENLVGSIKTRELDKIEEELEKNGVRLYFNILKRTKEFSYVWCVYLKEDKNKVADFLRKYDFVFKEFGASKGIVKEEINRILKKEQELLLENDKIKSDIFGASKSRRIIEMYHDRLMLKLEKYKAAAQAQNTEKTFVITGYVPEDVENEIARTLENQFTATVISETAEKDEILPVAFKNNELVSPVEEITASYSMPASDDIDPNPVMAVFYYWFFGMMFSDAGYGLLMMIVCGILGFSQVLEKGKRRMLKMFFWCGISTTLWGIAYGSFFGDLIGTVSKTFGTGNVAFLPVLIDPVNQALELLIISVAFGLVHILAALIIKFYKQAKSGDKKGAVYDVGLWIAVLLGISIFAVGMGVKIPAIKYAGVLLIILGAVGIVLTGGRDKKSLIMRIFSGVLSLYDITGFVGDILSYSRLMALGLATGVIASVVNVLGSLGGNSPVGIIMFVIISIFGHSLNFAINMLGAYVHTNRLQYVEFYQKFYGGGGRRFNPLKMETKYFDFLE